MDMYIYLSNPGWLAPVDMHIYIFQTHSRSESNIAVLNSRGALAPRSLSAYVALRSEKYICISTGARFQIHICSKNAGSFLNYHLRRKKHTSDGNYFVYELVARKFPQIITSAKHKSHQWDGKNLAKGLEEGKLS